MAALQADRLTGRPWLNHGFGTRDDNYWTPPEATARLHQVHGATVVPVDKAGDHGDGDALITATPGLWLEVRTADCVPVLLADPVSRVVAAIHAGWRGTAAHIVEHTIRHMALHFGSRPGDLQAVVGPAIGPCCFEVGPEVAAAFPESVVQPATAQRKAYVDLWSANQAQLRAAGVPDTNIATITLCTVCRPEQFHSFRRDKSKGRMISAIGIAL